VLAKVPRDPWFASMSKQSLAGEFSEVVAAVMTAPAFADERAVAERARRTRKSQILRTGEVAGEPYVDRLYPVSCKPTAAPRSRRYALERQAAERFLHRLICTEEDWTSVPAIIRPIEQARRGKGRVTWGKNYRGRAYGTHSIADCEAPTWTRLEKRRGKLLDDFEAAAGLLPELSELRLWRGCVLVREWGRPNRRGKPSIKRPFYELAADYAEAARLPTGRVPHGFFPALARHLSLPEFSVRLSPYELKNEVCRRHHLPLHIPGGAPKLSGRSRSQH